MSPTFPGMGGALVVAKTEELGALGVSVEVSGLSKRFQSVVAVDEVNLHIAPGEFVALLGPSGCGKTTTLRCIAGLEMPTEGSIQIGGTTVLNMSQGIDLPPEKREIGFVFQSYAIWPHMTIEENIGFPLKMRGHRKSDIKRRVEEILELLDLRGFADRSAVRLSGGQQQRVALGRALAAQPGLVLFDEPLSNLDAGLRRKMRFDLKSMHRQLGFTAVYVTHDRIEAFSLADRVVIMRAGKIEQQGSPQEVSQSPKTAFVANFIGYVNSWKATVVEKINSHHRKVHVEQVGEVICRTTLPNFGEPGTTASVVFMPNAVRGDHERASTVNCWRAKVREQFYNGNDWECQFELGNTLIEGILPERTGVNGVGSEAFIYVDPEECLLVPEDPTM